MEKKRLLFSIILWVVSCFCLFGNEVYFRSLGIKDGLSQPSAMSIWQDKLGRIWIGNDAVNCFNGNETRVFRLSQYFSSVEDSNIHHLCGTDSTVYLLAEDRVVYINLYTNQPVLTDIRATAISVIDKHLYAINRHSITMYNLQTKEKKEIFTDLHYTITNISPIDENLFWVGTTTGLLKVDIQKKKILSKYLEGEYINAQFLDSSKRLWLGTRSKMAAFISAEGKEMHIKSNNQLFDPFIYCFAEDRKGAIWLGTLSGLYKIINNKEGVPELDESRNWMTEIPITSLYTDIQGTLWVGPYYGDIRYMNSDTNNLSFYICDEKTPEQLHGIIMGAMTEDDKGNLFVASETRGINVINVNQPAIQHITTTEALPSNKVKALWFDSEYNRLFVGLFKDSFFYLDKKTNRFEAIRSPLLEPYNQLTIENIIPYNDMLILLSRNGIYKMDRRTLQVSRLFENEDLDEKCSGNIRTIHIDGKNRLWVSSLEEGLFVVDLATQSLLYSYGDGLKEGSIIPSAVNAICGNAKTGLYMSTLSSGVLVFDEEKNEFKSLTQQNKLLLSNVCYNIALSAYDNLIVTTDKGISIIEITVKKEVGAAYHFHLRDLPLIGGLGGDCGVYVSPFTKKIYIGGLYGLFSFSEHDITQREQRYSLYFSSLVVNNQPVSAPDVREILKEDIAFTKQIILPYDQNTINIGFTTTDYIPSSYITYEYKMDGLDQMWIAADNNTITYSSLRPGKYKLTVRETENPQKAVSLEIVIKQPYWFSWFAILLYICLITFLLVWFVRFNKSKVFLKSSLEMEKKEKERIEKVNQEKVTFLTNIADEFRAPLSIIITILNKIHAENESFARGRIGKVLKQSLYLQNLITRLLEFSQDERNELHIETVQNLIEEDHDEDEIADNNQAYTMLIIDSDTEIRSILKDTFSFAYKIIEARNGDEGYTLATTELPDIILSEISIPGISGIELCKMLKTNIEVLHIPVILISSQPSDDQHTASVRAGADDYIVKPFRVELLMHRCNSLIRSRKNISQKYVQQAKEKPHELIAINKQDQLFLDSALHVIEENIENTAFDISLWSKSMGVGRTSLFNQIKSITGMTPNDYILSVKINKAMSLLEDKACYPVADIAYKLGYSDPTYFSRTFKKIVGLSPQQYRKEKSENLS